MPQLKDGTEAKLEDIVIVRFRVVAIHSGEEADNISLIPDDVVEGEFATPLAINAKFCSKEMI